MLKAMIGAIRPCLERSSRLSVGSYGSGSARRARAAGLGLPWRAVIRPRRGDSNLPMAALIAAGVQSTVRTGTLNEGEAPPRRRHQRAAARPSASCSVDHHGSAGVPGGPAGAARHLGGSVARPTPKSSSSTYAVRDSGVGQHYLSGVSQFLLQHSLMEFQPAAPAKLLARASWVLVHVLLARSTSSRLRRRPSPGPCDPAWRHIPLWRWVSVRQSMAFAPARSTVPRDCSANSPVANLRTCAFICR